MGKKHSVLSKVAMAFLVLAIMVGFIINGNQLYEARNRADNLQKQIDALLVPAEVISFPCETSSEFDDTLSEEEFIKGLFDNMTSANFTVIYNKDYGSKGELNIIFDDAWLTK
jgi:hypothetical protein